MKQGLVLLFALLCMLGNAQIYTAKAGETSISFHSSAPLEDIDAVNKGAIIVFQTSSNRIQIKVTIQNFKFKNSLMEEHFNENYMETEKKVMVNGNATYPNRYAEFDGKVNEAIDYSKDGENKVTVSGKLSMHGVSRETTIEGTLTKKGEEIMISAKFPVKVEDYEIKVPSMYVKNIAEVVDVTINSTLVPHKKK